MSFYTAEIAVVNGEETASLFKWETLDDARKRLHTHMGYHIGLETCSKVAVTILNDNLNMWASEEWEAPVPEPEPEPTPEPTETVTEEVTV